MINVFFNAILPVFAVTGLGYVAGRRGVFDAVSAGAVNDFVFMIALPALMFGMVAAAPIDALPWRAAGAYLAAEVIVMAVGAVIARVAFQRSAVESLLLGMTAGFCNHVFIVLPISVVLYGADAAQPVLAIILLDSVLIFAAAIVALDVMSAPAASAQGVLRRAAAALWRNPPVLAIGLGLLVAALGLHPPEGVRFFLEFLGNAAAPAALFALGVALAARDDGAGLAAPGAIAALKLGLAPPLVWLALQGVAAPDATYATVMLTAAGPCGAMPFVLALRFGAPTAAIARAILISTVASAPLLSLLAA